MADGNAATHGKDIYDNGAQPQLSDVALPRERRVEQPRGKVVYWVMPGPRQLSPDVFGTPNAPKMTLAPKLKAAKQAVAAGQMPPAVPETLKKLPILVAAPLKARNRHSDGSWWIDAPTPFGDDGRIVQGSFTAHYKDRVAQDPPGTPPSTPDTASMTAEFSDPQGHNYRVVLKKVLKPPFPGYRTQGGVMIESYHHGLTGTGSPLMPKVKTHAAFWGMGDVYIDDKLADKNVVMHMMTTEVVRDRNYHLPLNNEMPLAPDQRLIKGQATHTHLIVLPLKVVHGKGPVFQPLKTAFKLPNGKTQPFMHIMFEQDNVGAVQPL
ncbi:hypothetical protein [Arhodomonas aquaeolei]|uniref:hypothetical protein n=1 Tax=Arhodomonas aquaeolei TaxID=2369 RepID=UPI0003629B21|nr:hypothetical protein [Arhodomonas aquaeolei]